MHTLDWGLFDILTHANLTVYGSHGLSMTNLLLGFFILELLRCCGVLDSFLAFERLLFCFSRSFPELEEAELEEAPC